MSGLRTRTNVMFRRQRRQERDRKTAVPGWNPGDGGNVSGNERAATLSDAERAEMEGLGLTANEWLVKPCTAAQVGRLLSPAA